MRTTRGRAKRMTWRGTSYIAYKKCATQAIGHTGMKKKTIQREKVKEIEREKRAEDTPILVFHEKYILSVI